MCSNICNVERGVHFYKGGSDFVPPRLTTLNFVAMSFLNLQRQVKVNSQETTV